jgi:uncharacterized protein
VAAPKPNAPLVPHFEVLINGSPLPSGAMSHVSSVSVDERVDLPSMFALELAGSDTQAQDTLFVDDATLCAIGNTVEIRLGYVGDLETLLIGEVTALEPEFLFSRIPSVTIRGYDRRHRLQRGRQTRTFVQQKDSDIASQIASEAGLTAQTEDSGPVHDYVVQANQTNYDFLRERAWRCHYEVVVEDKTLFFRPAGHAQSEVVTLDMGQDLLEFMPRLSSAGQPSEVSVRGWSPKDKEALVGQSRAGDEVTTMDGDATGATEADRAFGTAVHVLTAYPAMAQAEVDQIAKARLNDLGLDFISGEGVCWGRTDVRAGKVIRVDGVGQRFSGPYYVTAAVHSYTPQRGYSTQFCVKRNAS